MKKTYMAPQMEEEKMMEVLPLCGSGVTGGSVIEDVGFGGTDNVGVLDPGAKIRVDFDDDFFNFNRNNVGY